MSKVQERKFTELVERQLASNEEARELWIPIADEFDRTGPEAAREYLDAASQDLQDCVQRLLDGIKGV